MSPYRISYPGPLAVESTRYRSSAGVSYNLDTVGQGPTALAVGAGGGCLDSFTLLYPFSPLSPSLWETARYRLKYCLKGPLNPKQPTNQRAIDCAMRPGFSSIIMHC